MERDREEPIYQFVRAEHGSQIGTPILALKRFGNNLVSGDVLALIAPSESGCVYGRRASIWSSHGSLLLRFGVQSTTEIAAVD